MILCEYGCGREGKYQFKNGKWCCKKFPAQCPEMKKNNKKSNTGLTKIVKYKTKVIFKPNSKEICEYGCGNIGLYYLQYRSHSVWCCSDTHHQCKKVREERKFVHLGKEKSEIHKKKLKEAHEGIKLCEEHKRKIKESLLKNPPNLGRKFSFEVREKMSCSKKGKSPWNKGISKYTLGDPELEKKLESYRYFVLFETSETIKIYPEKIKNLSLRSKEYHLDHRYSICEGFLKNIHPKIIGHFENLEILDSCINSSKQSKCSITLKELKNNIIKVDGDQFINKYWEYRK